MTKPLTDAEIAEMRARCDAASKGPWEFQILPECLIQPHVIQVTDEGRRRYTIATPAHSNDQTAHNMKFVAHARTDLPRALDTIEAQQALLKKLTGQHTAGCASLATRKFWEYGELEPCNLQCDCPCGEIRKFVGGE